MPLVAVVDSIDAVPEAARSFYTEVDGKFILDAEIEAHPKALGLKTALEKERKAKADALKEAGKFKDVDLERYTKFKDLSDADFESYAAWKQDKDKGSGDFDAQFTKRLEPIKKDWDKKETTYKTQLEEKESRITTLTRELHKTKIENELAKVAGELGVRPEAVDDVLLHGKNTFSVDEHGNIVARDAEGDVITGKNGNPLTLKEWLDGKTAVKPHWFLASSGGGAGGGNGGASSRISKKSDFKSTTEKVAFISKHGQKAFDELPI